MTLFCVGGIKTSSTLSSLPLSCQFRPASFITHSLTLFTPLGLGLVRFVGGLRRDSDQEL
jgi:hypothetical protein